MNQRVAFAVPLAAAPAPARTAPAPAACEGAQAAPASALDDPALLGDFTRWSSAPDGSPRALSQFQLSGLHCAGCAGIIEHAVHEVPGVHAVRVAAASAHAEIEWDPRHTRVSRLVAAIELAGYGAAPDLAAPARGLRQREQRQALWRLFVAGFCMMQVMMVAAPAYLAAPGEISADLLRLLNWAAWFLSVPVLLFSAAPFFSSAWRALRSGRIAMDLPVAIGIAVTFVASSGATFEPGGWFGHEVYFDSLTMFVFFLLGGRTLELRARHRAAQALEKTLNRLPDTVLRAGAEGGFEPVSVRALVAGDRVRVLAGQAFPADGSVLEGATQADEALLTGESRPRSKALGSSVVAGSINLLAPVLMRVERLGADTRFDAIVALMRSALLQRPAATQLADRLAGPFLWGVLGLAALAALVWSVIDPSRAVWVAVSVLIVTCPCALSLAAPSARLAATGALARHGVLWRRLEAFETLARVDTLFIDKTGTLTEDRLVLRGVRIAEEPGSGAAPHRAAGEAPSPVAAGPVTAEAADATRRLLEQAAALAGWSSHPLSRALVGAAGLGAESTTRWSDVSETPGCGLQARGADGRVYRLGSSAWVQGDAGAASRSAGSSDSPYSSVWFGPQGHALAGFEFEEKLRDDSEAALQRLRGAGVRIVLLSGDRADAVQSLARRLNLDEAIADATPQSKLDTLAQAQAQGHVVAMAGDGLNDGPVLARADVSFAFAQGSALIQSHADALVLANRLQDVAFAFELARRHVRVVRQNLAWALTYNTACIPLALLGWLPPWAAGGGMALSSLAVVLNSMRLARL